MYSKLAVFSALVATASAECPNMCSGHGVCTNFKAQFSTAPEYKMKVPTLSATNLKTLVDSSGTVAAYDMYVPQKDSCTCFTHSSFSGQNEYKYTEPDCSAMTCPSGVSWNGQALSTFDNVYDQTGATTYSDGTTKDYMWHTQQVSCSNQGKCNSKLGTCECFDGYTGDACQRSKCPNDCSGAGVCHDIEEIVENVREDTLYYGSYMTTIQYTAWDRRELMGCVCDRGHRGPDCSRIECPSTSDPLNGLGAESGRDCSSRGTCDYSQGVCGCFPGYFGTACEIQRNRHA